MIKTLIFVGHFEIGEKYSNETKKLIHFSKKYPNYDKAILINDIGLFQKYEYYSKKDIKGLQIEYHRRLWCAVGDCLISQLPNTDKEILKVVDIKQFDYIKTYLKENKTVNNKEYSIETIINKEIIPILIKKRIDEYSFKNDRIVLFTEKHLRNVVGQTSKNTDLN